MNTNNQKRKRTKKEEEMEEDEPTIHFNEIQKNEEGDDVEMDPNEEVQVEFLFSEMRDNYFHNIKTFLGPLLDYDNFNVSEMSDTIINQVEVGNVIKVGLEDDEEENKITTNQGKDVDVYGVFTILNLNHYKNLSFVSKILEFVSKKAKENIKNNEELEKFLKILENSVVGLIINERAINLPFELVPPLINLTLTDIDKQLKENDQKYKFDVLLNISKFVKSEKQKQSKKIKSGESNQAEDFIYYKYEDEEIVKKSLVNFSYKIPYKQKDLEILENKKEPQYKTISLINYTDFVDISKLLSFNNKY